MNDTVNTERMTCLVAASIIWAGRAANAEEVLATAQLFYQWMIEEPE